MELNHLNCLLLQVFTGTIPAVKTGFSALYSAELERYNLSRYPGRLGPRKGQVIPAVKVRVTGNCASMPVLCQG